MSVKEKISNMKTKVLDYLKTLDVSSDDGIEFECILSEVKCTERELDTALYELLEEGKILAVPLRRWGKWYFTYYSPTIEEGIGQKLDYILHCLGVPMWVKTQIFRGAKVLFTGEFGRPPGFIIIDYGQDPPLIFRDKLAGGNSNEVVNYRKRSKYKCTKGSLVVWYNYRGQRVSVSGT